MIDAEKEAGEIVREIINACEDVAYPYASARLAVDAGPFRERILRFASQQGTEISELFAAIAPAALEQLDHESNEMDDDGPTAHAERCMRLASRTRAVLDRMDDERKR